MSGPRLSSAQKERIVAQYRRGVPTAEIAVEFGVDRSYPSLLAKRYGATMRMDRRHRDLMSDAARDRYAH